MRFSSALLSAALLLPSVFGRNHIPHAYRARAALTKRSTSASHFVVYSDKWVNEGSPPAATSLAGWNVFALAFWLVSGPSDMLEGWKELTDAQRAAVKSDYAANGIKLVATAFGSTDTPTSSGADAATTATDLADFVKTWSLDGVDVDYEDFAAMNGGTAEAWLSTFTSTLRSLLPADTYTITHAPVAPWFTDDATLYPGGGYLKVNSNVGSMIDWYNVQFYNQGTTEYTDCTTLLTKSVAYPHASLFEIASNGVSLDKLVIGKPANSGDATNGYMSDAALRTCVDQAKAKGWDAGLMLWEHPDEPATFIADVWGSTIGSTNTTATLSSTTSTTSTSSTSSTSKGSYTRTSTTLTTRPSSTDTSTSTSVASSATSSQSVNCALPVDTNSGTCGNGYRCSLLACCSSSGYCGYSDAYCGMGCQLGLGMCTSDPSPTCAT